MRHFIKHLCALAFCAMVARTALANVDRLSDLQDRFVTAEQGWGEMGINTCAHQPGTASLPIQIGEKKYANGIGHHANGTIEIALDGEYDRFDAEVGLQPLADKDGSVVFQLFVDDQKQFDSGLMRRESPARPVSIALKGAHVLRLVVTDGGDGIACDCANWADARLARTAGTTRKPAEMFDVAPFARLVTSDPKRNDGARAGRTEEYHAEDIYLEWPLESASADVSCLGLNWLERRPLRELDVIFKGDAPPATGATVQSWVGLTASQGEWKPVAGSIEAKEKSWKLVMNQPLKTQKIRWILPQKAADLKIDHLSALTRTSTMKTDLSIETELRYQLPMAIQIYNGGLTNLSEGLASNAAHKYTIQHTLAGQWKSQRTQLRFTFGEDKGFSVLVDDVLQRGPIWVPDHGVFIASASSGMTLEKYKQSIAGKKTILDEVRSMPDQTLAQAMSKVHHPIQDLSPVMLSLANDNHKIIAERNGNMDILTNPTKADDVVLDPPKGITRIGVKFGSGKNTKVTRHLDGDWLPAPVLDVEDNAQRFRERVVVVPGTQGPVAIAEFELNSPDAPAALVLSFSDPALRASVKIETTDAKLVEMDNGVEISSAKGRAKLTIPLASGSEFTATADSMLTLRKYWEDALSQAAQIEVPDPLLMNVIRASQIHCLMAARNEDDGKRVAPWIASINYGPLESEANSIIRGMDLFGHDEFARRSFDYFISKYNAAGMLTTGYTLMGTGWHLQTLGQHYQLWRDQDWLKTVAPKVATACAWIDKQRHKTMQGPVDVSKMPQFGLAPPGVMADWGNYAYYFCPNGYYCAGLREAATALNDIGVSGADQMVASSGDYSRRIQSAFHATQALMPVYPLRDGTWAPAYPSQVNVPGPSNDFFPGEDGNRSWCYDVELGAHQLVQQGVLEPAGVDTRWMMNHMEDVQFLADGWFDFPSSGNQKDPFNFGGFAKVQPYYCRNGEIYAMRDDVKPFIRSYFNTLPTLLNTEVLSLQEHFNAAGAWNKTHETGYFLQQTRFMLVMEHGDALWLAPLATNNWMKDAMKVAVNNAPTRFGPLSYEITSFADKGYIDASIVVPTRSAPKEIVIRLRDPNGRAMKSVFVNGQPHEQFDPAEETVTISRPTSPLKIRATFQ